VEGVSHYTLQIQVIVSFISEEIAKLEILEAIWCPENVKFSVKVNSTWKMIYKVDY